MKRRHKKSGFLSIVIIGILLAVSGYLYTAPEFERVSPTVHMAEHILWNKKIPLKIDISDNRALKDFEISLNDGSNEVIIGKGSFTQITTAKTLVVSYPKNNILDKNVEKLSLKVIVSDGSKWNFLRGNMTEKVVNIKIDTKRPRVSVIANSYSITQGGSALVIVAAEDENMDTVFVQVGEKKFKVQPYKQRGYYATLIAWPFNQKEFQAKVIVKDLAGNTRTELVPLYTKKRKYKVSWIEAKDRFIDGKITDLASNDPEYANIENKLEKLRAINETMRLKNEELIHSLSTYISEDTLDVWKINKFYPLRNGAKVANYGEERHYYYKSRKNEVSQSYHVGYDLASTKMAMIKTSNAGTVVYVDENGIYGNMPLIDHGLGLYSLYGHCSQFLVEEGEKVEAGQNIAKTGISGLALGDHLHFGLLVQGIEVRPIEWFDKSWIRKNIDNIFKEANTIIEGK